LDVSAEQAAIFEVPGAAARLLSNVNWPITPLGPPAGWSAGLKTVVGMMLRSRFAMWVAWGPDLTFMCNDAYMPTLGVKRTWAIGARSDKVWEEIWPDIGPRISHVFATKEATWDEDLLLFLERNGYPEETYHTFSYSPLIEGDTGVQGMLCVVTEVTERVIAERRVATLRDLAAKTANARSVEEACKLSMNSLASNPKDFPFAVIRQLDETRSKATFMAGWQISPSNPLVEDHLQFPPGSVFARALASRETLVTVLDDVQRRQLPQGPWQVPVNEVAVVPMLANTQFGLSGFLEAGLNPHRLFDVEYRDFVELVARYVSSAIANATAYEEERKRAEALAAVDQAKTAFFSNVSHEFRTPPTLVLGPLDEALKAGPNENLAMAQRNGLRLMKLVNTLLDFARAEAGRANANFVPTDLPLLTRDLASTFQSAFKKA